HDATRVGGGMAHILPMNGYLHHCLFKYNPKFFLLLAQANDYEILYAGFGDMESGRPLDDRFATWAKYENAKEQRFDSLLLEFVARKTMDRPFRPGIDLIGDDLAIRHDFAVPVRTIRG